MGRDPNIGSRRGGASQRRGFLHPLVGKITHRHVGASGSQLDHQLSAHASAAPRDYCDSCLQSSSSARSYCRRSRREETAVLHHARPVLPHAGVSPVTVTAPAQAEERRVAAPTSSAGPAGTRKRQGVSMPLVMPTRGPLRGTSGGGFPSSTMATGPSSRSAPS